MADSASLEQILHHIKEQKSELQGYFDRKLSVLREEITNDISVGEVNREVKQLKLDKEITWKSNGNKEQFKFNTDIQGNLTQTIWGIKAGKTDYAIELIEKCIKDIENRNKLIRLADTSEAGWDTVKCYVANPIASDSEDEKRINKAENRALKKQKEKIAKRKSSRRYSSSFSARANYASGYVNRGSSFTPNSSLLDSSSSTSNQLFRGYRGKTGAGGACYACGEFGHFRRDCTQTNKQLGFNK